MISCSKLLRGVKIEPAERGQLSTGIDKGNVIFIKWLNSAQKKPKQSVAFGIPSVLGIITIFILLFSLNLDFAHLAKFTGIAQDTLAFHIYIRMFLVISVIAFSFLWSIRWLLKTYSK